MSADTGLIAVSAHHWRGRHHHPSIGSSGNIEQRVLLVKSADLLRDLHKLPVHHHATFKWQRFATDLRLGQLSYLPLPPYVPTCWLRSSLIERLAEPPAQIATDEWRFSHFAPRVWNNLPADVISADSPNSFKTRLTYSPLINIEYQSPCSWFCVSVDTGTLNIYFYLILIKMHDPL